MWRLLVLMLSLFSEVTKSHVCRGETSKYKECGEDLKSHVSNALLLEGEGKHTIAFQLIGSTKELKISANV